MPDFKVSVIVRMREDLPEPQGIALERVLERLSYRDIKNIRVGKIIEFTAGGGTKEEVKKIVEKLANSILSNPIIEDFEIRIEEQ
ncbi:MAG: phosphoribosylformylglycinamidine synthase subunit PurS [bacterium]|nr:phosphoribosylformylglycinamidine synthase subunit PurS [bacterium]